jgi:hypothetical protein
MLGQTKWQGTSFKEKRAIEITSRSLGQNGTNRDNPMTVNEREKLVKKYLPRI